MRPRQCCHAAAAVALLAFLGGPAAAQEQTVSIEGVVCDAQSAVLPGMTVEARHEAVGSVVNVAAPGGVAANRACRTASLGAPTTALARTRC